MSVSAMHPLKLQDWIIDLVAETQADSVVTDARLAELTGETKVVVQVHLEMMFAADRIGVVRTESGYEVTVSPAQLATHEAPSAQELMEQQLVSAQEFARKVGDGFRRFARWLPFVCPIAFAGLAWVLADPADRVISAICFGVAGLLMGVFASRELT